MKIDPTTHDTYLRARAAGAVAIYLARELARRTIDEQTAVGIVHDIMFDLFVGVKTSQGREAGE